jgi:hypothetical protein
MEKTAQQLRFEAAWHIKWPNDELRIFEQDSKGQYTWPEVQDTFEGFQLGEASGLQRAADLCDESPAPKSCTLVEKNLSDIATGETADAIRALMVQGESAGG